MKKENTKEKYLVTSALPYANGPLHIGHVAGAYLPADIFVRFQKILGNDVLYICGSDEHGAPISIKAEAEGVTPREIVDRYHESIKKSFDGLEIDFDNFSGTARKPHEKLAQEFFLNLYERGFVTQKTTKQWFDTEKQRFLADRYVEGECPFCGSEGARGDQCDSCGKLIDAVELKNPVSKISGSKPVIRETTHWYLNLPKFEKELKEWLNTKSYWKDNVLNFINNFLNEGLLERAITRDIDWGVPVPLEDADKKVLYVWFDAPIGYVSSTIEWAQKFGKPDLWKDYWLDKENTKLIHFIGKDNIIFHTIFFPSFLMEQDKPYVLPHDVPANEFLNLEGRKMSTSKNWTVWVNDFLKYFDGEYLRYYLAANAPETKDSDFYWKEFQQAINNDLANILGNLANRVFAFSKKYFDGKITKPEEFSETSQKVLNEAEKLVNEIKNSYQTYQVRKASKLCVDIARIGNKYFDETQPWKSIKESEEKANETLYVCAELLRLVSITFYPIIPKSSKKLRDLLGISSKIRWENIDENIDQYFIGEIAPLFRKIDDEEIDKQLEMLKAASKAAEKPKFNEHKPQITYEDFMKLEFRIVKVLEAANIPKSKKLLKLKVDVGNGEQRSVVAGISQHYEPEEMVGRKVPMLINLQPRKVMGVESQAMILAAHDEEKLTILVPEKNVKEGSEVS
ncbi:MAG: methionine--tRNA ligase [Candidatus Cloacimonetes bacterium]|nr:methionine--tRNA ligase [Candidatus Cloacimonadota bacterium]MCF7814096.1 methionine--tRNA ligase [Candidatus Cloacimonadota bacterium]MCF7867975.1 methionine--tRNA ligase [Candidatus Cloacimonadota bacterium]MCF7883433.1 methionine--tRNA ligase [Candidatus Cloacimonadota bacterium]